MNNGLRILLDAKDLIDVVEHARPITLTEFQDYLLSHDHKVVLTHTSIIEFSAPLVADEDFLKLRRLLQQIEALPVTYINEAKIQIQELLAAKEAYERECEYSSIDPYVRRWDETFSTEPSFLQMLVNVRIDEMIYSLWKHNPASLLFTKEFSEGARKQMNADRALPAHRRKRPRDVFINSVGKHFARYSVSISEEELINLGAWIHKDPKRCPGLRLHHDTYHELRRNSHDGVRDSDVSDFSHIYAIPYVDAVTLDRRMTNYVRIVAGRLHKLNPFVNYKEGFPQP